MATTIEKFDSAGGFSVEKVIHIDELHNAKELNSLEIKNSQYTDSNTTTYILRGINTATLALDGVGSQVPIGSNTMNFITGHIIATDSNGVIFTSKLESAVYGDASGNVSVMSTMETIIKDDIPSGQTWSITPVGAANRFSYSTIRAGTTLDIKWAVSTQVTSLEWA
jgi:predicted Zn-dependent protease|tara:strand:+ start:1548 stop:2048 length:501 start_codon:yes stop_codon:yes gene_type:complete